MKICIPVNPIAKPRMTQRDRWKQRPCVVRYRNYKDVLRDALPPIADACGMEFAIPMPASWSKKRKTEMSGCPHQQRPDIDNLVKGVLDAVLTEDAHVHTVFASKVWGYEGSLTVWDL